MQSFALVRGDQNPDGTFIWTPVAGDQEKDGARYTSVSYTHGRVGTYIGFEPALSQEIYAGADVFIMPSKSEPCGLAQMVACRYGTPPIVRELSLIHI